MKEYRKRAIALAIVVSFVLPATLMLLPRNAEAQPIVLQPSIMDTMIDQADPDTTRGQNTWIGPISWPNENSRMLIKFDLTGVTIPAGDEVTTATLDLSLAAVSDNGFDHPKDVDVYRVRTYWGEHSATWHKEPDYASERTSSSTTHSWDVTNVVKEWLSGEYDNYGMMLRFRYEDGDPDGDHLGYAYVSREWPMPPPPTWERPKLTINHAEIADFVDIELVEPQDGYTISEDCGCPVLRSTLEYDGTLNFVQYEIVGTGLTETIPAYYDFHTDLWVASLDCSKLRNIGPVGYTVTARAEVAGIPQDTDQITLYVENTFHLPRMAYIYYYSVVPDPNYNNFHDPPGNVYAEFEEFDGQYEIFRVDIETSELNFPGGMTMPNTPVAIVVAVPENWIIATDLYNRKITNLPEAVVTGPGIVPTFIPYEPPPGYTAYEITDFLMPYFTPLYTDVTYQLWFKVQNPWYG